MGKTVGKSDGKKTVATLRPWDCRWPIGHPGQDDFHFCGKVRSSKHESYCDDHAKRSVQPRQPQGMDVRVLKSA
jgi:GcrA cell cycle regulator